MGEQQTTGEEGVTRNVWLSLRNCLRKFELFFTFHSFYCAAQFLRVFGKKSLHHDKCMPQQEP